MPAQAEVERIEASNGALIFRLPLEVFSGYFGFAHLVVYDGKLTLVDVGSGFGSSHADLLKGLEVVQARYAVPASPESIQRIIITHGHVDHFGGLQQFKATAPGALIGLHELSRPVLVNYDERVLVTSKNMSLFLRRAGVPAERIERLLEMYMLGKRAFKPTPVDFTLHDGELLDGVFRIVHVPGHEPGLIMIQIGDVLLTADHILPGTSVALAPESLMPYTGVAHYVESLRKAEQVEGVRVALGGHEWAMPDYYEIARSTRLRALEKVERVLGECGTPSTIYEIATRIYGNMDGYSELLKLEQTGARIEYLNQRGLVMVDNLDALEREETPVLRYRKV